MKAVQIEKFGTPDVLKITELDQPKPKQNELLVRVKTVSINPLDYKVRNGSLSPLLKLRLPFIIGSDFAGIVESTGNKVQNFKPGDRVFGSLSPFRSGACAEYITVNAAQVAPIPDEVSFDEAAAIPIAGLTALHALRDMAKISEGEKVLINGASGGVGSFAVQLAKIMKAQVTGVCSTANVQFVTELGADKVIDYKKESFLTLTEKYDLFFDVVSNATLKNAQRVLSQNGMYVATLPSPLKLFKSFISPQKVKIVMVKKRVDDLNYLAELTAKKKLKVVISKSFSLDDIRQAHAAIENGKVKGKLVVVI